MKWFTPAWFGVVACLCVAHDSCPAQNPAEAVHPRGTFIRPADGIQDPTLDKAWDDYKAAISEAADAIRAVMDKRLAAAQGKGNLDAVQHEQASRAKFDARGILPRDKDVRDIVIRTGMAFRRANEKLLDAYDEVVGTLTRAGKVPDAQAARDERRRLEAGLGFPPMPNVPEPVFNGKDWIGWGPGWGVGNHEVIVGARAVRLKEWRCFACERITSDALTFEFEVQNRDADPGRKNSIFQAGFQDMTGGYLLRVPAKNEQGVRLQGQGEVIVYDDVQKRHRQLVQFPCPMAKNWDSWEISREKKTLRLVRNGKEIAVVPLPDPLLKPGTLHIGVLNDGEVDFRNLKVTVHE